MFHDPLFRSLLADHAAMAAGTYFSEEVRLPDGSTYLASAVVPDEVFNFGVPAGPASLALIREEAARRDRPAALMLPSADAAGRMLGVVAPAAVHQAAWMAADVVPVRDRAVIPADPAVDLRQIAGARPDEGFLDAFVGAHGEPAVQAYVRDTYAAALAGATLPVEVEAVHLTLHDEAGPAACATLYRRGDTAGLYNVATRADRTRRGHGRRVVMAALERAAEAGCSRVILQCSTAPHLLALYEGLGFRTVCSPVLVVL